MEKYVVGSWQANCYVLTSQDSTIVIDPGAEPTRLLDAIGNRKVAKLVLTHGHSDHIGAVNELRSHFATEVAIGKDDVVVAARPEFSGFLDEGSIYSVLNCEQLLNDGDVINFGNEHLRVIHTPGHTPGSVCLLSEKNGILFTGDTLFKGAIGATHYALGHYPTLVKSLAKLSELDANLKIFPGHGEPTVLSAEIRHVEKHYMGSNVKW
ncbi:MBL fold metallo-hydrolase [Arcanobacterium buesumense]|uniref:MBL fold metallo-hydrolase n=2 Tax=Arcanobacterium buesumense TaxID=2722751 RepID=A0A6H2EMI3_9ACTO|nr:MBL fold metallo-hydrolase [Arcanobacterium buesumense]